jgi:adenosine deaminase
MNISHLAKVELHLHLEGGRTPSVYPPVGV